MLPTSFPHFSICNSPQKHQPPESPAKDSSRTLPFNPSSRRLSAFIISLYKWWFFLDKLQSRYPPNIVRNQKYNAFTYPRTIQIFLQLYFLLVALPQLVPALKIGRQHPQIQTRSEDLLSDSLEFLGDWWQQDFIWSFGFITRTKGMVYTIIQFVSDNLFRKAKCAASTFDDLVRHVISKRRTRY